MTSFAMRATVACSTKRAILSGDLRGEPVAYLSGLKCMRLMPLDPELRHSIEIDTPHELLQTFIEGNDDIIEGDILVIGASEYPIRSCAGYPWQGTTRFRLVVEDLKR